MRIDSRICLPIAVLAVLAFSAAPAEEPAKEQEQQEQKAAEQEQPSEELPAVITTEWLDKRYGAEVGKDEEAEKAPAAEATPEQKASTEAKPPAAEPKGKDKEMTPEERAARVKEIEGELARLDKRLLSLRNPYLRGVTPATEQEKKDLEGMNNVQQIEATEKKIEELKKEKAKLESAG